MWWWDEEAFRVLTDFLVKDRNILNEIGTLPSLSTTNKGNLVGAINELVSSVGNATEIDSYSFANNGYIRWKNGFQIAWVYSNVEAGGTAWNGTSVYYSDHNLPAWIVSFSTLFSWQGNANSTTFWTSFAGATPSNAGKVRCFRPNDGTGNVGIYVVGFGKWK